MKKMKRFGLLLGFAGGSAAAETEKKSCQQYEERISFASVSFHGVFLSFAGIIFCKIIDRLPVYRVNDPACVLDLLKFSIA